MKVSTSSLIATAIFSSMVGALRAQAQLHPDPPIECGMCEDWNQPAEPFKLFGNTYYVGVHLSALLIVSDDGLILLDGGLPQSAALIDESIRKLGFDPLDIRLIGTSHAHFDHVGGVAAMQRASGAPVAASPSAAKALREGMPTKDDPQYAYGDGFAAVANVREVKDGETLTVGGQDVTVHFTPGHTPGGTSWTWRSCEGERCLDMVYADSLTAVSAPGFRYTDNEALIETLRASIAKVASLPCDIMVSTHPEFSNLFEKWERRENGEADAMLDPGGCHAYAAGATKTLDGRIAKERAEP